MTSDQSSSSIQSSAEPLILEGVARHVSKSLESRTLTLDTGAPIQVDGVDAEESVFVEIKTWGIEVLVVDLDQAVRDGIRQAQVRQVMVNPSAPVADDDLG